MVKRKEYLGVTGPTPIPKKNRQNKDHRNFLKKF